MHVTAPRPRWCAPTKRTRIRPQERQAWTSELRALHEALNKTVQENVACPVCGPGGARLWRDAADKVIEWDTTARRLLWTATQATVQRCGASWSLWRLSEAETTPLPLPPKLAREDIPMDRITELPGGGL